MLLGVRIRNVSLLRDVAFGMTREWLLEERVTGKKPEGAGESRVRTPDYPLRPLTAVIGNNNSGKSTLFRSLEFLMDTLLEGVAQASQTEGRRGFASLLSHGCSDPMSISILYAEPRDACLYSYELALDTNEQGKPHVSSERLSRLTVEAGEDLGRFLDLPREEVKSIPLHLSEEVLLTSENGKLSMRESTPALEHELVDRDLPALSIYGRIQSFPACCRVYFYITHWFYLSLETLSGAPAHSSYHVRQQQELLAQGSGGHRHINRRADNLANVLSYMRQESPDRYKQMLRRFQSMLTLNRPLYNAILSGDLDRGDARMFVLLLLLSDYHPRPLLLLDSPDIGLYPERLNDLLMEFRHYTLQDHVQIIYSTHNSFLIEGMHPEELWVFEREEEAEEDDPFNELPTDWTGAEAMLPAYVYCAGSDPLVRAMYGEGVGLGALWYSGYLQRGEEHASGAIG